MKVKGFLTQTHLVNILRTVLPVLFLKLVPKTAFADIVQSIDSMRMDCMAILIKQQ